ncbi:MAG: hypothetical protein R3E97_11955 [Candidatus Eisenbacteria bacterium]
MRFLRSTDSRRLQLSPMVPALVAVGFLSLLAQVVLIRELSVASYGNDLVYTLSLGCWLLWTAVGATLGGRRIRPTLERVWVLFLVLAPALLGSVVFLRAGHFLLGGVRGAYLPFPLQLLSMALALLPVGVLLGLLFQWAARLYVAGGRTLARAYAIESVGGMLGGVAGTALLAWGASVLWQAILCGLLAVVVGVFVSTGFARRSAPRSARGSVRRSARPSALGVLAVPERDPFAPFATQSRSAWANPRNYVGAFLIVALGVLLAVSPALDRRMTAWTHPDLVAAADTPYGRVAVTSTSGQTVVYENNALAYETEGTGAEEFVHLAGLEVETPRRVLILGGGASGLVREALAHAPDEVVHVDVSRHSIDLVTSFLPSPDQSALGAPSVRIVIDDPRRFLERSGAFDLILVGMPEPASGQSGRYYSREFFQQCAAVLGPGGVLALRLPSSENLWTRYLLLRSASIRNALRAVFGDVLFLPGSTSIVLASNGGLIRDPALLARRFEERRIEASLVGPDYLAYLFGNDRLPEAEAQLETALGTMHTDVRPVGYAYSQLLWLSQFFPSLASVEVGRFESWTTKNAVLVGILAWVVVAASFLALRRRRAMRRWAWVAASAFVGMVLESVLILNYQVQRGILYRDLGLLLTLLMAGLALGAAFIERCTMGMGRAGSELADSHHTVSGPRLGSRLGSRPRMRLWLPLRMPFWLPLAFVLLAGLVGGLIQTGRGDHLASVGGLLLLVGFLVGAVLAHASLEGEPCRTPSSDRSTRRISSAAPWVRCSRRSCCSRCSGSGSRRGSSACWP